MTKQQHATADHEAEQEEAEGLVGRRSAAPKRAKRKKDRQMTASTHWLFQLGLYKRSQGRITRQVTFAALMLTVALGAWRLSELARSTGVRCSTRCRWRWWSIGGVDCLSAGELAARLRFFDRRRSGDDQGFVADAERIDSQLDGGDCHDLWFGGAVVGLRYVLEILTDHLGVDVSRIRRDAISCGEYTAIRRMTPP